MSRRMSSEDKTRKSQEDSVWDANEFIEGFVKEGWESHWSSIKIICDLTLEELHKIGHLPRSQGTRECRKLVQVPVINDDIGSALWEKLATMARGDEDGNIDDTEAIRAWENSAARERMRQEINAMKYRQKTHRRSASPPPPSPKQSCVFCPPGRRHLGACRLSEGQPPSPEPDPVVTPEAAPRKLSWIFPVRRRSSAAAKSIYSPKLNEQWEEGFWQSQQQQQQQQQPLSEAPGPSLRAHKPPEVVTDEAAASASLSPKSKVSFPKRILRKLSGPQLLSNIGEFGESLGVGYGSREQGPVISSATEQLPYLRSPR